MVTERQAALLRTARLAVGRLCLVHAHCEQMNEACHRHIHDVVFQDFAG
jgi:hypothetical protein